MKKLLCMALAAVILTGCATTSSLKEEYQAWPLKPFPIEEQLQ